MRSKRFCAVSEQRKTGNSTETLATQATDPDIRNFVCQGDNSKIKIVSSFSVIKQCFVIKAFNNKQLSCLLNLAEYPMTLANSAYGLSAIIMISRDFAGQSREKKR